MSMSAVCNREYLTSRALRLYGSRPTIEFNEMDSARCVLPHGPNAATSQDSKVSCTSKLPCNRAKRAGGPDFQPDLRPARPIFMDWDSFRVFCGQTLICQRHSFKSFLKDRRRRRFGLVGQRGSSGAINFTDCHGSGFLFLQSDHRCRIRQGCRAAPEGVNTE
jgi:hypothetical protein